MPIVSPKLDDLTFDTVIGQLRARIPIHTREWTNHNESDPGITLIQLFAHLAEQIGYRLNQVPDKNYVEFMKLVGVRLKPAEAATTLLQFILTSPDTVAAFSIPLGTKVRAKVGTKPAFELDTELLAVPAQIAGLVTTRSASITEIKLRGEPPPGTGVDIESFIADRFALVWDGKTPKLKDMPGKPLSFDDAAAHSHQYLWIALAFNASPAAGFLGQRVSLRVQLDDDEQPDSTAVGDCKAPVTALTELVSSGQDVVTYSYYRPPSATQPIGGFQPLRILSDDTDGWTRSGTVRFDVPTVMGPIADGEWAPVAPALPNQVPPAKEIPHPLIKALKTRVQGAPSQVPVSGFLRVAFQSVVPALSLRALSFNVGQATNAETVQGELLPPGTGGPDQHASLAHGNILAGTLRLAVVDPADGLFHDWHSIESFDAAGPFDNVYILDPEAGEIVFGDGLHGRPPPAQAKISALSYRHGGGQSGEVDVGLVSQPDSLPSAVNGAVNILAARGGKDAETLDEAKARTPSSISTRGRAVTAQDFEFLALQTKGARLKRVVVVPLHAPLPQASPSAPGLDLSTSAPGVVSLIVVPDAPGPFPTPTEGLLYTVCRYMSDYRLLTTELYAVAPQYVRLFDWEVTVRAAPGFSRGQLRETIAKQLETYFHVLTGGPDGHGFPFGVTVHHADIVAQVFRVPGVDRVERVVVFFDGQAPDPDDGSERMSWRPERMPAHRLTNCPETDYDAEQIVLLADETVFVDASTLNLIVNT